jgi:hypothetical protein
MAKGQVKKNKEAKKPKSEKGEHAASAYKQSQGKGISQTNDAFKPKK